VCSSDLLTYGGIIADNGGANSLTKSGGGTLLLNGSNTYTGITTVSGGVLSIPNKQVLPWDVAGRYTINNGATLAVSNMFSDADIGTILATGNFSAGGAVGFDTTSGDRSYSVILSATSKGALGLTKLGNNTLTISTSNTNTGTTSVLAGTLRMEAGASLGGTSETPQPGMRIFWLLRHFGRPNAQ